MPNPLPYQIKPSLPIFPCRYCPTSPLPLTVPSFLIVVYIIFPTSSPPTHFSAHCSLASTPPPFTEASLVKVSNTFLLAKPNRHLFIFVLLGLTAVLDYDNFFLEILTLLNFHNSIVSWFSSYV